MVLWPVLYTSKVQRAFRRLTHWKKNLRIERRNEDCQTCLNLRLPDPRPIDTTYAELRRTAADRCELCELLQQVSEMACTGASTVIYDTDLVHSRKRFQGKGPAHLEVRRYTSEGCTSQGSFHFRPVHYTLCTNTVEGLYYTVWFYAASGRESICCGYK